MKHVTAFVVLAIAFAMGQPAIAARGNPYQHFVQANGVQLEYLDWGGVGPTLIFIPGLGDSAHVFDDLAPQFTDHFHVLAYSRRGCGQSEVKGPYDKKTLTNDLVGLMDKLGVKAADLAGHSAAGDELTEMGSRYPSRVLRLVYLDAAYDWSSPHFRKLYHLIPSDKFQIPGGATSSFANYLDYQRLTIYRNIGDIERVSAEIRARVNIEPDGTIARRPQPPLMAEYFAALMANAPRDYGRVDSPALAIYATHSFLSSLAISEQQKEIAAKFDRRYWLPFQLASKKRFETSMRHGQVMTVEGTNHVTLFLEKRDFIVRAMRAFLLDRTTSQTEHENSP